jgi:hypothetical protein
MEICERWKQEQNLCNRKQDVGEILSCRSGAAEA